jgi:type VI secretion system protein ImpE
MNAHELFKAGRLDEAIELLGAGLRNNPADARQRTFLFELLSFAGSYDRAEKQLDVLGQNGPQAEAGVLLYRSALHAERVRQEMFARGEYPHHTTAPARVGGTLNGRPFESIEDADPRIGPRLEVYAAGQYTWLPFEHIASVSMQPPAKLRDLLWASAIVRTGPGFRGVELGEVLLPILTPTASRHPDPAVRLGRVTEWEALDGGGEAPVGQKLLLVDGEEFPILELRQLEITPAPSAATP